MIDFIIMIDDSSRQKYSFKQRCMCKALNDLDLATRDYRNEIDRSHPS